MLALSIFGFVCLCFNIVLMPLVVFACVIADSLKGEKILTIIALSVWFGLCVLAYYVSPFSIVLKASAL